MTQHRVWTFIKLWGFVLPTRSQDPAAKLLSEELDVMTIYGQHVRARVADQTDLLYFVRNATPLRIDP